MLSTSIYMYTYVGSGLICILFYNYVSVMKG